MASRLFEFAISKNKKQVTGVSSPFNYVTT